MPRQNGSATSTRNGSGAMRACKARAQRHGRGQHRREQDRRCFRTAPAWRADRQLGRRFAAPAATRPAPAQRARSRLWRPEYSAAKVCRISRRRRQPAFAPPGPSRVRVRRQARQAQMFEQSEPVGSAAAAISPESAARAGPAGRRTAHADSRTPAIGRRPPDTARTPDARCEPTAIEAAAIAAARMPFRPAAR